MDQHLIELAAIGTVRRSVPGVGPFAVIRESSGFGRSALDVVEKRKAQAEQRDVQVI